MYPKVPLPRAWAVGGNSRAVEVLIEVAVEIRGFVRGGRGAKHEPNLLSLYHLPRRALPWRHWPAGPTYYC